MFNKPIDANLLAKSTQKNDFDNTFNNANKDRLRLDGPRLGFVGITGNHLLFYNLVKQKVVLMPSQLCFSLVINLKNNI